MVKITTLLHKKIEIKSGTIFFIDKEMLSYRQYTSLEQNEQVDVLLGVGIYLDLTRHTQNSYVELYALEDFYVEVYFDKITEEPLFLRAFSDLCHLDPYLNEISLKHLLSYY